MRPIGRLAFPKGGNIGHEDIEFVTEGNMRQSREAEPAAEQHRAAIHGDLTWRFPAKTYRDHEVRPGPAICDRCHAYLETDHWRYGERRYRELSVVTGVTTTRCPGCLRIERRLYEGEVRVIHDGHGTSMDEIRRLIHHEEARERITNPSARIAVEEERDGELYILTTTQFLARRIGQELHKAFRGALTSTNLPYERFTRVKWRQAGD
jgi:hypothetical protein